MYINKFATATFTIFRKKAIFLTYMLLLMFGASSCFLFDSDDDLNFDLIQQGLEGDFCGDSVIATTVEWDYLLDELNDSTGSTLHLVYGELSSCAGANKIEYTTFHNQLFPHDSVWHVDKNIGSGTMVTVDKMGDTFITELDLRPIYVPDDLVIDKSDDFMLKWEGEPLSKHDKITVKVCQIWCFEEELIWHTTIDGEDYLLIDKNKYRNFLPASATMSITRKRRYFEDETYINTLDKKIVTEFRHIKEIRIKR